MFDLNSIGRLASPAYFFRPQQIPKRVWREYRWKTSEKKIVNLPWGFPLAINPQESLGHNLKCQGIYDLSVTEALWSLTDVGELAIDVGANIGYMTSVLLRRVGKTGHVIAFEPHPAVFAELFENAKMWKEKNRLDGQPLFLYQAALGDRDGEALLHCNDWFAANRGTASLIPRSSDRDESIRVKEYTLDNVDLPLPKVHVVKVDVEGSELAVFRGMTKLLESKSVRDVVFEEIRPYPAESHVFLESRGYSILGLQESFGGLRLRAGLGVKNCESTPELPSYLATIDPARALKRLDRRFWRSFGPLRALQMR